MSATWGHDCSLPGVGPWGFFYNLYINNNRYYSVHFSNKWLANSPSFLGPALSKPPAVIQRVILQLRQDIGMPRYARLSTIQGLDELAV